MNKQQYDQWPLIRLIKLFADWSDSQASFFRHKIMCLFDNRSMLFAHFHVHFTPDLVTFSNAMNLFSQVHAAFKIRAIADFVKFIGITISIEWMSLKRDTDYHRNAKELLRTMCRPIRQRYADKGGCKGQKNRHWLKWFLKLKDASEFPVTKICILPSDNHEEISLYSVHKLKHTHRADVAQHKSLEYLRQMHEMNSNNEWKVNNKAASFLVEFEMEMKKLKCFGMK